MDGLHVNNGHKDVDFKAFKSCMMMVNGKLIMIDLVLVLAKIYIDHNK